VSRILSYNPVYFPEQPFVCYNSLVSKFTTPRPTSWPRSAGLRDYHHDDTPMDIIKGIHMFNSFRLLVFHVSVPSYSHSPLTSIPLPQLAHAVIAHDDLGLWFLEISLSLTTGRVRTLLACIATASSFQHLSKLWMPLDGASHTVIWYNFHSGSPSNLFFIRNLEHSQKSSSRSWS